MRSLKRYLLVQLLLFIAATLAFSQAKDTAANHWEGDIRKFESADSLQPPPQGAILFVGSSSIRMWESLAQDFPDYQVINRGFGGSELSDAVYFANRIILPYKPREIVVYAGDNDLANGKEPERVLNDYQQLVRLIHQQLPQARIGYIAIKPSLARWNLVKKIKQTNNLIRKYSSHDHLLAYIDIFTPMLGKNGKPKKELFAADGLHLNRKGYELWRKVVKPFLK